MSSYENYSSEPEITLPLGFSMDDLNIEESLMAVPMKINIHHVPIGKIYDISLDGYENPDFGDEFAELRFTYDKTRLINAGFIEDFVVFYYDSEEEAWKSVDKIQVDTENSEVIAYTSHFTPFVLTAIPSASGTVADPPSCIQDDFPAGIGGSGNAVFTIVDDNFKYYQDRDYYIVPASQSTENTITFAALGLDQSLGISTINGNSPLGPFSEHKQYDGDDYIVLTAHTDIDIYVMYDTRGGVDIYDTSEDAPWLTNSGFINTGYFLETTDAVQYYTVYQKSYNEGEEVHLHGNRKGVTDFSINTNYWVIMKKQGDTGSGYASDLCVSDPDTTPPAKVTNLQAMPGAGQVTLTWQNPDDLDFAGVVIRRSGAAPPMGINDGDEPTGTVVSPQCYIDTSVSAGNTYYYTIFSLDINNNYDIGESVSVTTSNDTDGDGLSDDYENNTQYPTGLYSDPLLVDTDADGIDDGEEVAAGTDPTNPDNSAPAITDFTRTSNSPTYNKTITFSLEGNDDIGITYWMLTRNSTLPLANNTNWQTIKPTEYTLTGSVLGNQKLYAWAKDAAGNVNNLLNNDIEAKIYIDIPSDDFQVCTTNEHNQGRPQVSISEDRALVVWNSWENGDWNVRGIILDMITGNHIGSGDFIINSTIEYSQLQCQAAISGNRALVVFSSEDSTDNLNIRGRLIDLTTGAPIGSGDFLISTSNNGNQYYPRLAISGDKAIVVWYSYDLTGVDLDADIRGRLVDINTGAPIGSDDFLLNTIIEGSQHRPEVEVSGDKALVVWEHNTDIYGRFFDMTTETPVGASEFIVNTNTDSWQTTHKISVSGDSAIVVWQSQESGYDIRSRIYDMTTCLPVDSSDFLISTSNIGGQMYPEVSAYESRAIVAWFSDIGDYDENYEIMGRVVDMATGVPIGDEDFLLSTFTEDPFGGSAPQQKVFFSEGKAIVVFQSLIDNMLYFHDIRGKIVNIDME